MAENIAHEDKDSQVVKYELGYHLVPSLGEDDLALRVTDLKKAITDAGGTIGGEHAPQSYVLSYTMRRLRGGSWEKYDSSYFGWLRFEMEKDRLKELEEFVRTSEFVIRHLIVKVDTLELPKPAPRHEEVVNKAPLEKKQVSEEDKGEVQEEELDKQIEELIT